MKFYTDLHLHSYYSRATSKDLNLEYLEYWAQLKGIQIVGTGDFTHPAWFKELQEKLEPAEEGLFKLKKTGRERSMIVPYGDVPKACQSDVRFMLTVEISSIYKRLDKVRKVHNVVFAPHFKAAAKLIEKLSTIGNLKSDGRPILGLDSRNLLEIVLGTDPLSYLIPAHIWTPWFSALGSKSGFDKMEDCFADLTKHIFAVETGLSSDPLMNWRLSQLDPYALVSNGDAHSPPKLGREATIYDTELSYPAIYKALSDPKDKGLTGTVEFYPEEGKYHYDGCRNCQMRMHPQETLKHKGVCPKCGKAVTVGVMARVEELADQKEGRKSPRWRPYQRLVPLPEVIGDAKEVGPNSKAVLQVYFDMLNKLGNEFFILMDAPLERIQKVAGSLIAEGVRRNRTGELNIAAGYDGEYGTIKIFSSSERENVTEQLTLF
ncbi:MAG TPA: endonuclease Q family protein [Candidatus Omnitrophota bacterium]|nr:endonuclease Q family protein [Candidatus Omnitrophota bacterium]